jgi:hypothetical protein
MAQSCVLCGKEQSSILWKAAFFFNQMMTEEVHKPRNTKSNPPLSGPFRNDLVSTELMQLMYTLGSD